ncbi:MAG: hypothetical protein A2934_02490 [Candidatus Sungbacteria bacterium RIFCSPLOWO2_01_FULL_47_10]|uniref:Nudix hydrolase domain-containing protein n=1 Tax=Candidatus Sungbacteria bacterium RIFCSPLOWO2_01_FULL_47_10 TaxID=1802276 RepID=A0A1G2L9I3_9BACT|nr:MAG: hypothetical protein A2934_02490 [Candidatus Sungbacteria bacterium RIFCSPLOWO2_01_FULL_47_10]
MEKKLFKVVITAIVVKDGRFLILRRSPHEKKFPGKWTVPGGKLTTADYVGLPKDTPDYWYNVLEHTLKREVKEEAGIGIKNIRYVTSLADANENDDPSLVISCLADFEKGDIALDDSMSDYAWVSLDEAKSVDLIGGIYEELEMAEKTLRGEERGEWKK